VFKDIFCRVPDLIVTVIFRLAMAGIFFATGGEQEIQVGLAISNYINTRPG
jgi:hypothetical protein